MPFTKELAEPLFIQRLSFQLTLGQFHLVNRKMIIDDELYHETIWSLTKPTVVQLERAGFSFINTGESGLSNNLEQPAFFVGPDGEG